MKNGVVLVGVLGCMGFTGVAAAESVPPARTGFQMDIRTGYSVPMGKLTGGSDLQGTAANKLSDAVSGQVPFIVDIGGKLIPELFLGGYLGLAFGGAGGSVKRACELAGGSCVSVGIHLGIELQYQIRPAALVDPWIGYGLGIESLGLTEAHDGTTDSVGFGGFEFARLMAGVDFRVSRVFGVGPFVDLSLAQYTSQNNGSQSVTVQDTATHEWLTVGARFVFFP